MNNMLFEGIIAIQEINEYEELVNTNTLNELDKEVADQYTEKFNENEKKAQSLF